MSDYEAMMIRNAQQKALRRKDAVKRLTVTLAIVLSVLIAIVGLDHIGFISDLFMVILAAITICAGAFKSGYIWRDVRW